MLIYVLLMSLVMGSFVQCLIDRYPNYLIKNYSYCDYCHTKIKLYDLIPIISFLILKGKCRNCNNSISKSKVFTETIFLIVFILIYINYDNYLFYQLLFMSLYLASFVDINTQEIPDLSIIIIIFLIMVFNMYNNYLLSIIILLIGIILSLLNLIGFGDIKLLSVLSFFYTFHSFIYALLISCVLALIYLIFTKQNKKGTVIGFAPFISISYFSIILITGILK